MGRGPHRWRAFALAVALAAQPQGARGQTILDEFETPAGWTAEVSDPGVKVELASDPGQTGMALRIDFNFESSGGHVLVRKPFALDLPSNYALTYAWRGAAPPIDFEFKLIDRSQRNVWWYRQREVSVPADWTVVRIKKPRLEFAWGPLSGGPPRDIAFIEIAITGVIGDHGSLWFDDLRLEPRAPPARAPAPPTVTASTSLPGHDPAAVLDDDQFTSWQSGALAAEQWLQLDFGKPREYGGLVIDWGAQDYALAYDVEVSDDGQTWTPTFRSTRGNGRRDNIFLPDGESRYIRLALHESSRGQGYEVLAVRVIPLELAASPNQFIGRIAQEATPTTFPRYFFGEQTYWTVVGVSGDEKKALLGDDGMLEVEKGSFSIEPFLSVDGALVGWNNVERSQALADGYLPIPSVSWRYGSLSLEVTALATGPRGGSVLMARYRVSNSSDVPRDVKLFLAAWPFQVLPPWQTLNIVGGVAPIHDLAFDDRVLWVNRRKAVIALTPPAHTGAATSDERPIGDFLLDGVLPARTQVSDPSEFASAAMQFDLHVPAGGDQAVYLAIPFYDPDPLLARSSGVGAEDDFNRAFNAARSDWQRLLGCVDFSVPDAAKELVQTVKTTLAYILITRSGAAIQPGPRTYSRSWIRDGAITAVALLEMGFTQEVRDFIRWYAGYQMSDGRIPCCVDRHGADTLPEYDSNGEFLYAVAEYYRYTRDIGFVNELWPNLAEAARYIESLRAQRLTPEYERPAKQAYRGLLPQSVSHEGYVAHPVHSYWDDFFALRGLKDAVVLADAVGDTAASAEFAAARNGLQNDVHASLRAVIADRKLAYVPASVELADFDPSSTAIAISPAGELPRLPANEIGETFQRYYDEVVRRRSGANDWDAYSPYELRIVGALVRLGRRDQAIDVLDTILADRRPAAWNQWPEILWRDASAPKFIGDMPHSWVGAGYVEAVRDLFAYERDEDGALVLAAGIPAQWLAGDDTVGVRRLPTHYGILTYAVHREGPTALRLRISGDLGIPPGGFVVQLPLPGPLASVKVNDHPVPFAGAEVRIEEFPADVVLTY